MDKSSELSGGRPLREFLRTLVATAPRQAALAALLALVVSVTEGVGLLLLVPLLQLAGVETVGSLGGIVARLSAVFAWVGVATTLPVVLSAYVIVIACQSALQRQATFVSAALRRDITAGLRRRLYRAIAGSSWVFFARRRTSEFIRVLTSEVDRAGSAASYVVDLAVAAAVSLVYVLLALRIAPAMTALVLVSGAALGWMARARIVESRASGAAFSSASSRIYAAIAEHLGAMKTAKSYNTGDRHAAILDSLSGELEDVSRQFARTQARVRQTTSIGSAVVLAAIVYIALTWFAMPTGQLLLVMFLFARLMPRLTGLIERLPQWVALVPAYAHVTDLEAECLAAAEPAAGPARDIVFARAIQFDQVAFGYGAGRQPVFKGLSLDIDAGLTTAIVGPSGAGKSTLADLLLGLLPTAEGRILVDGQALGPDQLVSWRAQIGYVAQDTFLFHDTVRANLLWARVDATEADLWRALGLAAAETFVRSLPSGLDTVLGDRGVLLSGGERQRLALARAFVRQPRLLILDEATSALDSENEASIQLAVENLHRQMTIVVITHRLSTIRHADRIHVIDGGRLVESGTWDDLLSRPGGRFRDLCRAQGIDEQPGAPGAARGRDMTLVKR